MRELIVAVCALLAAVGCAAGDGDPGDDDSGGGWERIPWSADLPPLRDDIAAPRGFVPQRAILHVHSPYSHDACDGAGYVDGVLDLECMAQMREGFCRTSVDVAYLSDHPDYAAWQEFADLALMHDGSTAVEVGGEVVAGRFSCDGGHEVLYLVGIEDELMPLGLDRHAAAAGQEAHDLYNGSGVELFEAVEAAGGMVFQEHPEAREMDLLRERQDMGLVGLEIFQLHALLDPDAREEIYGLERFGWIDDIGPFTDPESTAEPDLLFAAFHQEMGPNVERWDALAARGRMVGIAATDAHRNVLPMELRDGERPDGYRRNFRWFSNVLLTAEAGDPQAADDAVRAGRLYVAFEAFGTPDGLAFWVEDRSGNDVEMGAACSSCVGGTLHLTCPGLSPSSPRDGGDPPAIDATVFRSGEPWQAGCGSWEIEEPGQYRVRVDITPTHLREFFGDDPDPYLHAYPWVYTNIIDVAG